MTCSLYTSDHKLYITYEIKSFGVCASVVHSVPLYQYYCNIKC